MIDYRGIVRARLRERCTELLRKTERPAHGDPGTLRAVTLLTGEVKALTDLLIEFGEQDCTMGHQLMEAAHAQGRELTAADLDGMLPPCDEIMRANRGKEG
jgi:hypothetical protein